MEENGEDPDQVRGKAAGVWVFLQSCRPVSVALRGGDVGGYPLHGTGPGGSPRPGGTATDRAAATSEFGWKVGVHLGGGGNRGGGV